MNQFNFISLFLKQVAIQGDSIAVKSDVGQISYKKLLHKARQVHAFLNENADENPFIGINCSAGIDSYAYIIGVWLYGGAYVPMNSSYPVSYQQEVRKQTGITILLDPTVIDFDTLPALSDVPKIQQEYAYVIFTSGTTGKPKGVPVLKGSLNAFFEHYLDAKTYSFSNEDVFLQSYELSFDVSVFCFGMSFISGSKLVIPKQKGIKYLNIASCIMKEKVTVCSNVPSVAMHLYSKLDQVDFSTLRYCFFSGEALHGNWAKKWLKAAYNAQVYNCYGPTETTIVCTTEHLNSLDESYFTSNDPLPLGNVFQGTHLTIQDGELCFSGKQVFKGYLNQTKETFNDCFPTGDLAFFDEKRRLIFQGRKDQQVQVNGYRVELQAIDIAVKTYTNRRSVSFIVTSRQGGNAIVTVLETTSFNEEKVRRELLKYLPEHSQPQYLLAVESFPLNQNGKLDKQQLKKEIEKSLLS